MDRPRAPRIAEVDIEAYARDGFACLRGVCGPEWVERMRGAVERIKHAPVALVLIIQPGVQQPLAVQFQPL